MLDARRSQGTPAGGLLFRQVGAEPQLSIFDVVVDMNSISPMSAART